MWGLTTRFLIFEMGKRVVCPHISNAWMAMGMKTVGCTEAVAMDASDSVICGTGNVLNISCTALKDDIQRWGLGCF